MKISSSEGSRLTSAVTGCPARALMTGPTLPLTSNRSAFGPAGLTCTPGSGGSCGTRSENVTSTVCVLRWRSSASVP